MRAFHIVIFSILFAWVSAANAQVDLPAKDDLLNDLNKSIGKGGGATGAGVGNDLLNKYKQQLNQSMPCLEGNSSNCAKLPSKSGSASTTPTTPPGSTGTTTGTGTTTTGTGTGTTTGTGTGTTTGTGTGTTTGTGTGTTTGTGTGTTTGTGTGTTTGTGAGAGTGTGKTSALTRDKLVDAVNKSVAGRMANLGSDVSTKDLAALIRYVKAMNMIVDLYDSPGGKSLVEALLKKFGNSSANPTTIMRQVELMRSSGRELTMLQAVRREVGSKALASTIDDHHKGGKKMKRAIRSAYEKLSSRYHATGDKKQKARIRRVMDLLSKHSRSGVTDKVFSTALAPLTLNGRIKKGIAGKDVAKMLKDTDDHEWYQNKKVRGARIIRSATQK